LPAAATARLKAFCRLLSVSGPIGPAGLTPRRVAGNSHGRERCVVQNSRSTFSVRSASGTYLSYVPEKVMRCELRENLGRQAPRSDFPAHNYLPLNEAMSLSAGRKEPRFRVGGRTASSISRFCAGSARRYASVL